MSSILTKISLFWEWEDTSVRGQRDLPEPEPDKGIKANGNEACAEPHQGNDE